MSHTPKNGRFTRAALIDAVDVDLGALRDSCAHQRILPPNDDSTNTEAQNVLLAVLVDIHLGNLRGVSATIQLERAHGALAKEYSDEKLAERFQHLVEGVIWDIDPPEKDTGVLRHHRAAAPSGKTLLPDQRVDSKKVEDIMSAVVRAYAKHTHADPDANCKAHIEKWVHLQLHDRLKLHTMEQIKGRARIIDLTHQIVTTPGFTFTDLDGYQDLLAYVKEHGNDPIRPDRHLSERASGGGRRAG